jgi:hypothetical protein
MSMTPRNLTRKTHINIIFFQYEIDTFSHILYVIVAFLKLDKFFKQISFLFFYNIEHNILNREYARISNYILLKINL